MNTSNALAVVQQIPTFRPPVNDPEGQLERLTDVLYGRLAIANPRPRLAIDDVCRLAKAAQDDLGAAARASTRFLRAVFHAGFRPLTPAARAWTDRSGPLVSAIDTLLPQVAEYGVPQMHLTALTTSPPEQVLASLQTATNNTTRCVARDLLAGLDALADLMAVGKVERVGEGVVRVLHFRHATAAQRVLDRGMAPPDGFTHWAFEGPGGVFARLLEVVNVTPYNPFRDYLHTPPRVSALLQAVPTLLRSAVTGLSGRLIREGEAFVDPHTGNMMLNDGVAYDDFHIVLLGADHVIASWAGDEYKPLITRLFGL